MPNNVNNRQCYKTNKDQVSSDDDDDDDDDDVQWFNVHLKAD